MLSGRGYESTSSFELRAIVFKGLLASLSGYRSNARDNRTRGHTCITSESRIDLPQAADSTAIANAVYPSKADETRKPCSPRDQKLFDPSERSLFGTVNVH